VPHVFLPSLLFDSMGQASLFTGWHFQLLEMNWARSRYISSVSLTCQTDDSYSDYAQPIARCAHSYWSPMLCPVQSCGLDNYPRRSRVIPEAVPLRRGKTPHGAILLAVERTWKKPREGVGVSVSGRNLYGCRGADASLFPNTAGH